MDRESDEQRIYDAAKDEAAELVWKHRNRDAAGSDRSMPYRNPDLNAKNRFGSHLQKGAYARRQSAGVIGSAERLPKSRSDRPISTISDVHGSSRLRNVHDESTTQLGGLGDS